MTSEADDLIARLQLQPHPEGGHYRETFRDCGPPPAGEDGGHSHAGGDCGHSSHAGGDVPGRGASSAILFLLKAGEVSWWHRIDAAEVWHWHRGAALELTIGRTVHVLGPGIENGQSPQIVVPPGAWQMAKSLGGYTLVGCTVAPAFDFATFELAPRDLGS
jgi:predicted cupin superfamily sugar epimerase